VASRAAIQAGRSHRLEREHDDRDDHDEALIAAAVRDRTAFGPLYLRYADRIFRFCYRRLGDRAAAEDATSRVFERAIAALPKYRDGPFRAWLFTIARNTVIDLHRSTRVHQPLDAAALIPDGQPGPEETLMAAAESSWIRGLLTRLTPEQRQIVELRLAGLSDREIADVLGRSHTSVRSAQYRALLRLRTLVNSQIEEEDRHAPRRS
jgi:RNA polymerase sigma-70 factor (ECF subfamily)